MNRFEELAEYCGRKALHIEVSRGSLYWHIRLRDVSGYVEMKHASLIGQISGYGDTLDEAAKDMIRSINLLLGDGMRMWSKRSGYYNWDLS